MKSDERQCGDQTIALKKAIFFVFVLSLFFLPAQNYYLNLQTAWQPPLVQALEVDLPAPAPLPLAFSAQPAPYLTARSALVLDRDSSAILYQKNTRTRLLPASTAKIMTAMVVLDHYSLDEVLEVGMVSQEGQDIELQPGERLSVRSLLYGLLVASANDAAQVLAQNYPGGEPAFVAAMNQKAKKLNLADTRFVNPTGLDSSENGDLWADYSLTTTLDLARLAATALQNSFFAQVVATPGAVISDVTGQIIHSLYNINQLLGHVDGLKGVKTGWTEGAGECLVSYVERDGKGIVVVVLGSQDRFGETRQLIDWAFANHEWVDVAIPSPFPAS